MTDYKKKKKKKSFRVGKWGKSAGVTSHIVEVTTLDRFCTAGSFAQCSVVLLVKFNLEVMENRIFPKLGKRKKEKVSRQILGPEQVCACFPLAVNRVMNVMQVQF